jgi:hypothetical protein
MTPQEQQEKLQLLKLVKLMLTLNVTLYSIDDFKSDPYYSATLKKTRNKVETAEQAIENKVVEIIGAMFIADETTTQKKLEQYEEVAKLIAKADFDDLTAIEQGLIKYYQDKENERNNNDQPARS